MGDEKLYLRTWRCPWCKALALRVRRDRWRHRLKAGWAESDDVTWFRCSGCGQDGTLGFLEAKLRGIGEWFP